MPPFSVGDRVKVNDPEAPYFGWGGEVKLITEGSMWPVSVQFEMDPPGHPVAYKDSELVPAPVVIPVAEVPVMGT